MQRRAAWFLAIMAVAAGCSRESQAPAAGSPPAHGPSAAPSGFPSLEQLRPPAAPGEPVEGVALAVVFDTSGSMNQQVADGAGGTAVKRVTALRALTATVDRIAAWVAAAPPDAPRRIDATLIVFEGQDATTAIPMGRFDATRFREWIAGHVQSGGATPLGPALLRATEAVLPSPMLHKHVVVITDGENTNPPAPAPVLKAAAAASGRWQTAIRFHFIAFDVDARVFDPVKAAGASVVAAADARKLGERLRSIVENEILLESDESTAAEPAGR